jgi:hypothetical protein
MFSLPRNIVRSRSFGGLLKAERHSAQHTDFVQEVAARAIWFLQPRRYIVFIVYGLAFSELFQFLRTVYIGCFLSQNPKQLALVLVGTAEEQLLATSINGRVEVDENRTRR